VPATSLAAGDKFVTPITSVQRSRQYAIKIVP
jgi:hypothetical protein